jgi:hypothetical protein
MIINPRTNFPIVLHSVRRHELASLSGWMIRIPQLDKNAINPPMPNSHTTLSRQDTKARKACFYCKEEGNLIIQCPKKHLDQTKKKAQIWNEQDN